MASDFGATYSEMEGAATKLRDGKSSVDDTLDELQGIIDELVQEDVRYLGKPGATATVNREAGLARLNALKAAMARGKGKTSGN